MWTNPSQNPGKGQTPPPSRNCLAFGNIWNGNTSLTCLLGTPDNAIGMGQFVIADMGYCIYLSFSSSLVARRLKYENMRAHWGEICFLLDCWNFFILQILQASSQIKHFSTQPWVWQSVSFWLWGFKREEFPLISSPCLSVCDFHRKFYVAHFHFEMQNARLFFPTEQIQAFLSLFFSISMLKIL